MEKHIRRYVLTEVRNLNNLKSELETLKNIKRKVIGSTKNEQDGQPRAKYKVGDSTSAQAIELAQIDFRISHIEKEIRTIQGIREELFGDNKRIFEETCIGRKNIDLLASQLNYSEKQLRNKRGKILRYIATSLGIWIDVDNLQKRY